MREFGKREHKRTLVQVIRENPASGGSVVKIDPRGEERGGSYLYLSPRMVQRFGRSSQEN